MIQFEFDTPCMGAATRGDVVAEWTMRQLGDWIEVRELTALYNRCFDEVDAEGWADTFVPNGALVVVDQSVTLRGHDALVGFIRGRGWGYLHMTLDPQIEVRGSLATQRCNLLMMRRYEDRRTPQLLATGRYIDELERTAEGWRFVSRAVTLDAKPAPPEPQV